MLLFFFLWHDFKSFCFDINVADEKDNHKDGNDNFVAGIGACDGGAWSNVAVSHGGNGAKIDIDEINKHLANILVNFSCKIHGISEI
jgi:hypothetical protein